MTKAIRANYNFNCIIDAAINSGPANRNEYVFDGANAIDSGVAFQTGEIDVKVIGKVVYIRRSVEAAINSSFDEILERHKATIEREMERVFDGISLSRMKDPPSVVVLNAHQPDRSVSDKLVALTAMVKDVYEEREKQANGASKDLKQREAREMTELRTITNLMSFEEMDHLSQEERKIEMQRGLLGGTQHEVANVMQVASNTRRDMEEEDAPGIVNIPELLVQDMIVLRQLQNLKLEREEELINMEESWLSKQPQSQNRAIKLEELQQRRQGREAEKERLVQEWQLFQREISTSRLEMNFYHAIKLMQMRCQPFPWGDLNPYIEAAAKINDKDKQREKQKYPWRS